MDAFDLPLIWAALLVLAVFMYVLLDGFDLGVGILFPFVETDEHRDIMMNSVAPVWDGNETWLVLGGAGLFAAFPKAYAALMPAIYMPIGFMLIALIFRGVAFEFRFKASGAIRRIWDQAFHWGSVVTAFAQGLVLGAIVQGINLEQGHFNGTLFDWLTPFSFITGFALVWGYTLLGAGWLILKTEGELYAWAQRAARLAAGVMLIMMVIVTLWVPTLDTAVSERWGLQYPMPDWSRLLPLSPVPLLVAFSSWMLFRSLRGGAIYAPYLWTVALFLLGYLGLLLGIYPYLVPYQLTFREAAAAPNAQALLLVGALVLLPLILGYTAYAYWVFRGKVRTDAGYH
ncbi:MAG: cytochrome d ubiquinol oxidase subunit II [Thiogranum sp.]|nr:cytochrome d ubiquinol oxidase subunit II [Thiogranum sp.]